MYPQQTLVSDKLADPPAVQAAVWLVKMITQVYACSASIDVDTSTPRATPPIFFLPSLRKCETKVKKVLHTI